MFFLWPPCVRRFPSIRGNVRAADKRVPACGAGAGARMRDWRVVGSKPPAFYWPFPCNNPSVLTCGQSSSRVCMMEKASLCKAVPRSGVGLYNKISSNERDGLFSPPLICLFYFVRGVSRKIFPAVLFPGDSGGQRHGTALRRPSAVPRSASGRCAAARAPAGEPCVRSRDRAGSRW